MTLKHFLIGIGLHNLTGLKAPIKILSNLGHSTNYNLVCEVETAEAELALKLLEEDQRSRSPFSSTNQLQCNGTHILVG